MEETSLEAGTISLTPTLLRSHCGTSLLTSHSITLQLFAEKNVPPCELKTFFACIGALSTLSCGYQEPTWAVCLPQGSAAAKEHGGDSWGSITGMSRSGEKTQLELICSTINKAKLNSHSCLWFSLKLLGFYAFCSDPTKMSPAKVHSDSGQLVDFWTMLM